MSTLESLHREVLFPQVRVETAKSGGSGTIIYSVGASSYILSCEHVIDDAISVKKEWDPKISKEIKKEFRQIVSVEFFDYENTPHGRSPITYTVDGDIAAYDKSHDMALIKLRAKKPHPYVAKLLPRDRVEQMLIGTPIYAVGCQLLHDPVLTTGIITHMGDEIDYKDYWMGTANIIFGSSGGAVFTADTHEFIGIPSRVDVVGWGTPVTHLGYFSPITRVYQFLEEQLYQFIYDSTFTEAACEERRAKEKQKYHKVVEEEEEAKIGSLTDRI